MGHPVLIFKDRGVNSQMYASLKNGPHLWVRCKPESIWMIPMTIIFRCGDTYEYTGYSKNRCSAVFKRKY